ncbi:UDP-GlcNAc:betaGal beta-1,3-N-acetylglucosaminyltransferase-like protein 1 isoform X2 [Oryx dammah]|uniref:UDP-GlcNAc:betaGal beta-1,3-N-acetylglucosaminyltransferase-like protein 1 isoform X2 n=1 Tax=Oryx dammah TaxID=59534 RepID=UPI001A9AF26A|nr:UDP-GlcNAc:betaGal beta-1,3-N-acetylglucosaminyltransferase-like protein 1 isoform X2 [Oryx dammah]
MILLLPEEDDVMMPQRVRLQHEAALRHPKSIIGCQVTREPPNSTERYTRWINQLAPDQLLTQVFTSNGPTVIMPTWFCSRAWFAHVGPFDEGGRGVPEDLLFFYEHLRKGGGVVRVDQSLLLYRYHPGAATHSVLETTIWAHRVRFLEEQALPHWATFTIWNAGRQGRRLYRSLTAGSQHKVAAFCDVDENKIRKGFYCYEDSQERPKPRIPVLHFRAARPPFVICVKLDLTGGAFEDNLRSLNLQEGRDFLHFS